jgi:signal recognition particle subunit SEC65
MPPKKKISQADLKKILDDLGVEVAKERKPKNPERVAASKARYEAKSPEEKEGTIRRLTAARIYYQVSKQFEKAGKEMDYFKPDYEAIYYGQPYPDWVEEYLTHEKQMKEYKATLPPKERKPRKPKVVVSTNVDTSRPSALRAGLQSYQVKGAPVQSEASAVPAEPNINSVPGLPGSDQKIKKVGRPRIVRDDYKGEGLMLHGSQQGNGLIGSTLGGLAGKALGGLLPF